MSEPVLGQPEGRLNGVELWLLDVLTRAHAPLWAFQQGTEDMLLFFNRRAIKFASNEVLATLSALSERQLVRVYDKLQPHSKLSTLTEDARESRSVGPDWYVELTQEGAAAWEEFVRPNWSMYVKVAIADEVLVASGIDPNQVRRHALSCVRASGLSIHIDIGQVQQQVNWQAFYWKSFDKAWFVRIPGYKVDSSHANAEIIHSCHYAVEFRDTLWRRIT